MYDGKQKVEESRFKFNGNHKDRRYHTNKNIILLVYFLVISLTISTLEVIQLSNVRITIASVVRSNTISQNENEKSHKW